MRLTENRIRQIIKEEAKRVLAEVDGSLDGWECEVEQIDDNFDPRDDSDFLVTCSKGGVVVKSYWGGSFKPGKFGIHKVSTDPGRRDDEVTIGGEPASEDEADEHSLDAFKAAKAALVAELKKKRKDWESDPRNGKIDGYEWTYGDGEKSHGGDFPYRHRS